MGKKLNDHQFVEMMANIHLVIDAMDTALGPNIADAIEAFLKDKTKGELDHLHSEVLLRTRELAEVHLRTAQRQFRGARNAPDS